MQTQKEASLTFHAHGHMEKSMVGAQQRTQISQISVWGLSTKALLFHLPFSSPAAYVSIKATEVKTALFNL